MADKKLFRVRVPEMWINLTRYAEGDTVELTDGQAYYHLLGMAIEPVDGSEPVLKPEPPPRIPGVRRGRRT